MMTTINNNQKLRITYFPMEQKYSVWDKDHNLIKEWFDTREAAEIWIKQNTHAIINTNFLKEWQPFDKLNKNAKRAILSHFMKNEYKYQPTHEKRSIKPFKPVTFSQIDNFLGLAYTSSGDYAGLWVCNGGYLWADNTHHFIGFAINELNEVIGIADDVNENEIFIKL